MEASRSVPFQSISFHPPAFQSSLVYTRSLHSTLLYAKLPLSAPKASLGAFARRAVGMTWAVPGLQHTSWTPASGK